MDNESGGDFFGKSDYRDRADQSPYAPTPVAEILDPEIEEFAGRVRNYVRENAQLKTRIAELETLLARMEGNRDELKNKLDRIAEHVACVTPMPATSA